jgi:muconolactone delta-isomerase
MRYLVFGRMEMELPPVEEMERFLNERVHPTLNALAKFESEGKVLGGGVPVGERALAFIVEASSHDEIDRMVRELPLWGLLNWEVTPLQTFEARMAFEREFVKRFRKP